MKPIYFHCHYSGGTAVYRIIEIKDEPSYKYFLQKDVGENMWRHRGAYRSIGYAVKGLCVRLYSSVRRIEPFNKIFVDRFKLEIILAQIELDTQHFIIRTDSLKDENITGEFLIDFKELIVPDQSQSDSQTLAEFYGR